MSLRITGKPLSQGNEGEDVAQVHAALRALGRMVPVDELGARVFGTGTAATVRALQAELGVDATGVVDPRTVEAIDAALGRSRTTERVVRGTVLDDEGRPLGGGSVSVALQRPGGETSLGVGEIADDGTYQVRYVVPRGDAGPVDLRVVAADAAGPLETVPSGASVVTDAAQLEVIDLVAVRRAGARARSELDVMIADVSALTGGRDLADLHEGDGKHEVSLLATQSGYATAQVATLVRAHQLARETGVPAAVFHGLLRGGMPSTLEALLATDSAQRAAALEASVASGLVPARVDGRLLGELLDGVRPAPTAADALTELLGDQLDAAERAAFVAMYFERADDPAGFWIAVDGDARWQGRAERLQLAVQLGALTNHRVALVKALLASGAIERASDVARISDAAWRELVVANGGAPPETPGATAEEQVGRYVSQITLQVEAAFATRVVAARLGDTPVAQFLEAHPAYDLERTYPDRFFAEDATAAGALTAEARADLLAIQRLYRLTASAAETIVLANQGVRSALQIARIDRDVFATQVADTFETARAHELHAEASRVTATAVAVFGEYTTRADRTGLRALPRIDTERQATLAAAAIPNWETLFGSHDLCACDACASAHGPSAYLVDVLQFFEERGVRGVLFARRPDLGGIELSCENTNTLVPTVDLVTEILEDAVAPPPPFVPFTLPMARASELAAPSPTQELRAAFDPPLVAGARIEELEPEQRWRIYDEAFAYSITRTPAALEVTLRSRQTSGPSAVRRAAPQYLNRAAYRALGEAVYPWTLPFDLPGAEGAVFLAHLGVTRHDLIATLRDRASLAPFDPIRVRMAAERLGLTDAARRIIAGEPLTPALASADLWGGATPASLVTVRDVLDRSGLSFADLAELVATRFVDPSDAIAIRARSGERSDTCDPSKLEVTGLTEAVLDRMQRFVRLRAALGWTIHDLDRAIATTAVAGILDSAVLVRLDQVRALAGSLRLSIVEVLSFWGPIDTSGPDALYRRLFFAAGDRDLDAGAFDLTDDAGDLVRANDLASAHGAALQAVFRIDANSFATLVAPGDRLTLETLSRIHRHAVLARSLGLTVRELASAIELTQLAPFDVQRPRDAAELVAAVEAMRASGLTIPELEYLLHHRASDTSPLVPIIADDLQSLADLRDALVASAAAATFAPLVQDRVAASLGIPVGLAAGVLARVRTGAVSAEQQLVALVWLRGALTITNAAGPLAVLEKTRKVVTIVQRLQIPEGQLDWLFRENPWLATAPDAAIEIAPFDSWSSLLDVAALRRELDLEAGAFDAILGALTAVATAPTPERLTARNALIEVLAQWQGWRLEELETLLGARANLADQGVFEARVPDDYRVALVVRVARAMRMLARLGASARDADAWCDDGLTTEGALAIRRAARAKHDDDAWARVAPALQDLLRDRQRAALVAYLTARPAAWGAAGPVAEAGDLLAHFLVDVEMTACQQSSRTKQAISSVQMFAQRALLGLEAGVTTADARWDEWSWMKSFRTWEANRKVWLYPENFLEPDLRDNKTPLFAELEDELLQAELDDQRAETAVRHYVEKLDELARLEVVGAYEDEAGVLHVFGRTDHAPRRLYYRRRDGAAWTAWARVNLDIDGDHVIPVVWHRRLLLIWPVFAEKQAPKRVVNPPPGGTLDEADRYWEIKLSWAEYQQGSWSGPQLSDPVTLTAYEGESEILFGDRVDPLPFARTSGFMFRPAGSLTGDPGTRPPLGTPPPTGATFTAAGPRRLVPPELFAWKAFPQGERLIVRGYLRRDYRGATSRTDRELACVFGELRFDGCRKLVSAAPIGSISGKNIALAPSGTKFDRMWFTGTGASLVLFDGTFPVIPDVPPESIRSAENTPSSIAGDPAGVLENKLDIPVLGRAPTPFRILAPHQDLQFVADRPFFYTDRRRAFLVTSTGHSHKVVRPDLGQWVAGNLGTMARADWGTQSIAPVPATAAAPLTLLVADGTGRRVARELPPVTVRPAFRPRTLLPVFYTNRSYRFVNVGHPYACSFVERLDESGVRGLLSLDTQSLADPQSFDAYAPTARVEEPHPFDAVELGAGSAFEVYNWELFFHIPLLIADRLRANQRFADAQRWFHYIFDPTGSSPGDAPQRYWRTRPFHDRLAADYEAQSVKAIEEIIASGPSAELRAAVEAWRERPFSPHAIARLRTTAYQKSVVMKYLDNLIEWADQLFARDTLETINEATQLYVLAAEILGRQPEIIDRDVRPPATTFDRLALSPGGLGNALEQLELLLGTPAGSSSVPTSSAPAGGVPTTTLAFCVPENAKLLAYWTTVADRLSKIRSCRNIAGQLRQLPLFEPPIDPALLVRARAAGLDLAAVIAAADVELPSYRFATMLQRAVELTGDVKNLGAALLTVLEKRDAEALSTLRAGQEVRLLQAIRDVRVRQIDEARAGLAALEQSRALTQVRKAFYETREPVNAKERASLSQLRESLRQLTGSSALRLLAGVLHAIGAIKVGAMTTAGLETGPSHFGDAILDSASALDIGANLLAARSKVSGTEGELERRVDDWRLQVQLATIELRQIEQQLVGAEVRIAIAEAELRNHDRQLQDARDVDQLLRTKLTSKELYEFSIAQLSGMYFQSYLLACELAKRAERCMQHELGLEYGATNLVNVASWNTLRQGLWVGEHLAHDLKRLELAYLDGNVREYELTKHVSLAALDPEQLLLLKTTGVCEIAIQEWFFDLDTPGHFLRRIKSVAVTLPCVTGPFTTIHGTLTLLSSTYRRTPDLVPGYARTEPDPRFVDGRKVSETIVTSTGQNDAGVFEVNLRDERYLPFEGAGAVSAWRLELPTAFEAFDYDTISDVVVHLRYTARDGGEPVRAAAISAVEGLLADAQRHPLTRMLSLRDDFPSEWHRFVSAQPPPSGITIELGTLQFPFFARDRTLRVVTAEAHPSPAGAAAIQPGIVAPDPTSGRWSGAHGTGPWTITTSVDRAQLTDIAVLLSYAISR